MHPIEFFFEFASTYSYPAAARIESLAQRSGVSVVWRPFLLGPIFQSQGWNDSPFNLYAVKGRYMWRDLERICSGLELPFRRPSTFPRSGLLAARVVCHAAGEPWVSEFVRRIYRANFAEDREISDPEVVVSILQELGRPRSVFEASRSPESKERLRAETARAAALGIFGAPSFVVGDELFWGNDRLEQAVAWASGAG